MLGFTMGEDPSTPDFTDYDYSTMKTIWEFQIPGYCER